MTYKLIFLEPALKEWNKLDGTIRNQFKKKLAERLQNPHVVSAMLRGRDNRYKIKLRDVGYRLVYEVIEDRLVVRVVAVGKRERNQIYNVANSR